jgi:nucleoside-diphosphate-sugar epimerase
MRAIILGANGYIGKHLTDYLNLLDWDLTCYDIQNDSILPNSLIEYFKLDISDKEFRKLQSGYFIISN